MPARKVAPQHRVGIGEVVSAQKVGGGGEVAHIEPGLAAAVVGGGVFRVEPDGLVIVGDGAVEVTLLAPGIAAVVVGGDVFRVEPDGLVMVGDGAVEVTLVAPGIAAVVVGVGVFRVERTASL
jgi:hypothetical protein